MSRIAVTSYRKLTGPSAIFKWDFHPRPSSAGQVSLCNPRPVVTPSPGSAPGWAGCWKGAGSQGLYGCVGRGRRAAAPPKRRLFVIDSHSRLQSTARRAKNRQQEIADISNGGKALAMERRRPARELSQWLRGWKREPNRNLGQTRRARESVDRPAVPGPAGDVKLKCLKPYTRSESAAKVGDEDLPN